MPYALSLDDVCPVSKQTYLEDLVCAVFQAVTLALGIGAVATLLTLAGVFGNAWHNVSFSIYGATLIIVYLFSMLYHATRHPERKRVLKSVDHATIHLLIAGTYTPFALVTLGGGWGWSILGVVWGLAVVGIALQVAFGNRYRGVGVVLYLAMGWLMVIVIYPLVQSLPAWGVAWMVLGGLLFTGGVPFYLRKSLRFNHVVWHSFVLAGNACFYFVILFFVLF